MLDLTSAQVVVAAWDIDRLGRRRGLGTGDGRTRESDQTAVTIASILLWI
ncbi:hypothetical protein [Kitasatospora sp. NPDC051705]